MPLAAPSSQMPCPWAGWARASDLPPLARHSWGIFGLGVMGRAAAQLASVHGAILTLVDENAALPAQLGGVWPQATWRCGPVAADAFAGCEAVLVSTGVSPHHPSLLAAAARGCLLVGELELMRALAPDAPIVAITGTNGKSTTTALLGALLRATGRPTFVGGNLAPPACSWLLAGPPDAALVLELSSYQIDAMHSGRTAVSVVLNLTPDHLERYQTMARYQASKQRLVAQVAQGGTAVLNADDPQVVAMAPHCPGRVWWFGTGEVLPGPGVRLCADGTVVGQGSLEGVWPHLSLSHDRLLGQHNRLNALAALLALQAFVAPAEPPSRAVMDAYHEFSGLPHRLQLVGHLHGARWLDDSKATNDAAAATALRAVAGPTVLLLGGLDKGGGYREVCAALLARPAKLVVAFGAARATIAAALHLVGIEVQQQPTLLQACRAAAEAVVTGDTVLLAPACASFDEFANYVARGNWFAQWVQAAQRGDGAEPG